MIEFLDVSIEQTLLILLFSFSVALTIFGIVLYRFRIFDRKDNDGHPGARPSPCRAVGRIMIIVFGILDIVMLMVMIMSFFGW